MVSIAVTLVVPSRLLSEPVMYDRLEPGTENDGTVEVVLKLQVRSVVEFGPVSSA